MDRRAHAFGHVEIRDEYEVERVSVRLVRGEVGFDPVNLDAYSGSALAGLTESLRREVDGRHLPPALGEPHCMPAVTTAEIERASRWEAVECVQHDGARLAVRVEQLVHPAAVPVAGVHGGGQLSRTETRSTTTGCDGCSVVTSPSASIRSTVS